jgi:hypothetical protein
MYPQQFLQVIKDCIPLAAALFTATAATAAWVNTILARKTQEQQRKALKYQMVNTILDYRYDGKNYQAKKALAMFLKGYEGGGYSATTSIEDHYKFHLRDHGESIDSHRHYFITYFIKLHDLHKVGLLLDKEMEGFVNEGEYVLFTRVIKPMEKVVAESMILLDPREAPSFENDTLFPFYERLHSEGFIG